MSKDIQDIHHSILISDLSLLIAQSQKQVAIVANSSLTLLFWEVGDRINAEILKKERAAYGKQIVSTVSILLEEKYGRNFTEKNVRRMIQFAANFPDFEIVVPLARQLSWSHFIILIPIKSMESRLFYAGHSIESQWGKRELRHQISRKIFERSEIANIQQTQIDISLMHTFKDPYILDFLGIQNTYLEQDLEKAILRELEAFILELGKGFAFLERQKRMIIDGEDFYLDLLFYNRNLRLLLRVKWSFTISGSTNMKGRKGKKSLWA